MERSLEQHEVDLTASSLGGVLSNAAADQKDSIVRVVSRAILSASYRDVDADSLVHLLLTLVSSSGLKQENPPLYAEARQSLSQYLFRGIQRAADEPFELEKLARICQDSRASFDDISEHIQAECVLSLRRAIALMLANDEPILLGRERADNILPRALTFSKQKMMSNAIPNGSFVIPLIGSSSPPSLSNDAHVHLTALQAVSFLHTSALLEGEIENGDAWVLISLLCILLITSLDSLLAHQSRNAAVICLHRLARSKTTFLQGVDEERGNRRGVFDAITGLLDLPKHRTTAFTLWACIAPSQILLCHEALAAEHYWQKLHQGLCQGSPEQRKYCLAILQASIDRFEHDINTPYGHFKLATKALHQAASARFAVLFETIVLSRYLNQVQDALPDLTNIAMDGSGLGAVWLVTLLQAALSHGMQDSIRNIIGTWTLCHGSHILDSSGVAVYDFLEKAFLPWAAVGSLYSDSFERISGAALVCRHGESVCSFLVGVISSVEDPTACVRSILSFIHKEGGRAFPFARAFILDAVIQGTAAAAVELDTACINLLVGIGAMQGFQDMVQDLMRLQCLKIAALATADASTTCNLKPIQRAARDAQQRNFKPLTIDEIRCRLQYSINGQKTIIKSDMADFTIAELTRLLRNTNCGCLAGAGLLAGIEYLKHALQSTDHGISESIHEDDVVLCLRALWDEIEVQEYPRRIMMVIPPVVFSKEIVGMCSPGSDLTMFLSKRMLELQTMSENRVYIFGSLSESLRMAFSTEEAAQNLPLTHFLVRYATSPPSTRTEFEMEMSISSRLAAEIPGRTYQDYYGEEESYGHACMVALMSSLPEGQHWTGVMHTVLDELLQPWLDQKTTNSIISSRKSTSQLQVVLMCLKKVAPTLTVAEAESYLVKFTNIMAVEPLPRFRYLFEWMILQLSVVFPDLRSITLQRQKQMALDFSNPKLLASTIKINTGVACLPDTPEEFAAEHLAQLVPLSASAKIVIRHEAQWTLPRLWDHLVSRSWTDLTENPAYSRLNDFIRGMVSFKDPPPGRLLERFDPVKDNTLSHLFAGNYLRIDPPETPRIKEEHLHLIESWKITIQENQQSEKETIKYRDTSPHAVSLSPSLEVAALMSDNPPAPLQTKTSSWQDRLAILPGAPKTGRRPSSVIVIASFIDNAYNIGGLSRVGEIFGIESLQVRSLKVLQSKDFTSVSVSSHCWLPIEELEVGVISDFLAARRLEGYQTVGIEQTDSSRVLGREDCVLPEKIVLVLGSEREGIPARMLAELDFCVEIEQVGVTRSMNVQTAAAVVLYEYSRQRRVGR